MNILVIDGQGGRLGCQMVRSIAEKYPGARLMAVGTNSAAAAAMAKACLLYTSPSPRDCS